MHLKPRINLLVLDALTALVSLGLSGFILISSLANLPRLPALIFLVFGLAWLGLAIWQLLRLGQLMRLNLSFDAEGLRWRGGRQLYWNEISSFSLRIHGGRGARERGAGLAVLKFFSSEGKVLLSLDSRLAPMRALLAQLDRAVEAASLEARDPISAELLQALVHEGWGELS